MQKRRRKYLPITLLMNRTPVRDDQQFDLDLMIMMLKKEEMAGHLCFKSKTKPSLKPKLSLEKVTIHFIVAELLRFGICRSNKLLD